MDKLDYIILFWDNFNKELYFKIIEQRNDFNRNRKKTKN